MELSKLLFDVTRRVIIERRPAKRAEHYAYWARNANPWGWVEPTERGEFKPIKHP